MPRASQAAPAATSVAPAPLLVEFGDLWGRGLTDPQKLWELFDRCEMYMYRPEAYFGAPVFGIDRKLITPVFSSEQRLTEFIAALPDIGAGSGRAGFDWVAVSGAQLFSLPVRARWLAIDPVQPPLALVDLSGRDPQPPLAGGAPPAFINLEVGANGQVFRRVTEQPQRELQDDE